MHYIFREEMNDEILISMTSGRRGFQNYKRERSFFWCHLSVTKMLLKKMKHIWIAALSNPRWSNQNKRVSAKAEGKKPPNPVPWFNNFMQFLFILSVVVREHSCEKNRLTCAWQNPKLWNLRSNYKENRNKTVNAVSLEPLEDLYLHSYRS